MVMILMLMAVMMKQIKMLIMDSDDNIGADESKSHGDGSDADGSRNDEVDDSAHGNSKDDSRDDDYKVP